MHYGLFVLYTLDYHRLHHPRTTTTTTPFGYDFPPFFPAFSSQSDFSSFFFFFFAILSNEALSAAALVATATAISAQALCKYLKCVRDNRKRRKFFMARLDTVAKVERG